jgi:hypothetical protein
MKKILACFALAVMCVAGAAPALAYEGGWSYDRDEDGLTRMTLGDASDGTGYYLIGTGVACGDSGVPYSYLKGILSADGGYVRWGVDKLCDNDSYARVCIYTRAGSGCSTFMVDGWDRFNN